MRLSFIAAGLLLATLARAEEPERDRLDKGEIIITTVPVAGCSLPEVTMRAVLEAPPEQAWAIIDQCARYKETFVRIKESAELSRVGNTIRCKVTLSTPVPFLSLTATTVAETMVTPGKSWVRQWKLESGDYKQNTGSWTLTPFAGNPKRTLAQYRTLSEPNIWVPDWVQGYAMKKGLPSLIEKLRSELK
jgi:hypothetical protein